MASTAARQAAGWLRRQRRTAARVSAAHTSTPRATTTTSALRRVCSGRMYLQEQGHSASFTIHPILDPRSLFPVSRIGIPADSLTRPVSNKSSLQGFLGTLDSLVLQSYRVPTSCQRSWVPSTSPVFDFRPAGFLSSIPRSAPTFFCDLNPCRSLAKAFSQYIFLLAGWAPSSFHFLQKVLHYPIFI